MQEGAARRTGVDVREQRDAEEERGRAVGDGLVAGARLVDLNLRLRRDALLLSDLVGEDLGVSEDIDGGGILEDVALAREYLEDFVLDLLELFGIRRALLHQPALLLLEVGPLLGHHDPQQLL